MHPETWSWLPLVFAGLIGLAILVYAILDGYDIGVGILMRSKHLTADEQNKMIASIGPFWDANETWLVLGVGLLLVAFPAAYSLVLRELYLPFTLMILSLMVRGVSFDFRTKAKTNYQKTWNRAFHIGSVLMSLSQGYILGSYILGFQTGWAAVAFSCLVALSVTAAYCLIGATWLIMKSEDTLQKHAVQWARQALIWLFIGIIIISITTPLISSHVAKQWFSFPNIVLLAPVFGAAIALIVGLFLFLQGMPKPNDDLCWLPFVATIGIFLLCFHGLAYSFYPYIIPNQMTIYQTTTSNEALWIMFIGAAIVLPLLFCYTAFAYKVFHGKTKHLSYD